MVRKQYLENLEKKKSSQYKKGLHDGIGAVRQIIKQRSYLAKENSDYCNHCFWLNGLEEDINILIRRQK